ncbi:MAG: DNA repair protein RecN [Limisphaerales bacterium]
MLTTLRIKNLALVADLTLELRPGFNALTGETGAGKSILIGALGLVLGERADRQLLRAGTDACTVEAVFDVSGLRTPLSSFIEENGLEPAADGQLLLKRVFTAAGANRQFINGSPATLAALAQLGEWLVDLHGPHDHQSLFSPARQLELLDAFAGLGETRAAFAAIHGSRAALDARKAALIVDERTYAQRLELLRHQTREIAAARLRPGEDEEVEAEHRRASNAAQILQFAQGALEALSEGDENLLQRAGTLGRALHDLQRLDPAASALGEFHEQAVDAWRGLQHALSAYADKVDLDPARLAELEERLNLLQSLKRKYGPRLEDVVAFGAQAQADLAALEGREAELARLDAEAARLDAELRAAGAALTAARKKAAPKLARAVVAQLQELGFPQSAFEAALGPLDVSARTGFDAVEFQFAPNPGEPARPLRAIASSGELARVMLAVKTVLAAQDEIPVLVFDEVDANVGGETAHAVGARMREIGTRRQVLCITHLAPVAAAAETHYVVEKEVRDGRTVSEIRALEGEARIEELARMLGGGEAARKHAASLVKRP